MCNSLRRRRRFGASRVGLPPVSWLEHTGIAACHDAQLTSTAGERMDKFNDPISGGRRRAYFGHSHRGLEEYI